MLSYQDMYELSQSLSSDDDTTNLTLFKKLINVGQHKLEASLDIYYTDETRTFTVITDAISGTSNQDYKLPENFVNFTELYVTVGTTQYPCTLINDESFWRDLNATTTQSTSSYPQFCFIKNDRVSLYPIPGSSDTNTATFRYNSRSPDLYAADYVTGTITTLANAGTAVTGSGTTWTSAMVGRYFKITNDEQWYKIASFGTTTTITLDSQYQGLAIAAGTDTYTIGQMPITPPDTHDLPVFYALWKYFQFRKDRTQSREYERDWKEGLVQAKMNWANKSRKSVILDNKAKGSLRFANPNDYPLGMS